MPFGLEFARRLAALPHFQSRDMVLFSRAGPWGPHPQLPSSVSTLAMGKVVATELFGYNHDQVHSVWFTACAGQAPGDARRRTSRALIPRCSGAVGKKGV